MKLALLIGIILISNFCFAQTKTESSQILFAKKANSQGWSIYSIQPNGENLKTIIPFSSGMGEYNPSIAPDGKTILFNTYRYRGWKLASYDVESKKITRLSFADNYFTNGTYSPDGSKIVYEKNVGRTTQICIASSDFTNEIILTSEAESAENRIPVWTPNGKSIIYYSERNKVNDIFSVNIETRVKTNLTQNKNGNDFAPSISPDGKTIAFFSDRNGYLDLYMMNLNGENQTLLTKNLQNENNQYNYFTDANTYWIFKSAWSPDGNYIVFTNSTSNNIDLFTIHKNGNELKNITNSPESEYTPTWGVIN